MKKTHIIAIIVIAIAIGAIISTFSESATYADFTEAIANPEEEFHVVGKVDRTTEVEYDPQKNPNLTVFRMVDRNGKFCRVFLNKSKPQDFERAESVVLIGSANGSDFYANDILMKCPSKYNEENKINSAAV